jgi:hypothetical protein
MNITKHELRQKCRSIRDSFGEEFIDMELKYIPEIQELMQDDCTIRICVHSDGNGSIIYKFNKDEILEEAHLDVD